MDWSARRKWRDNAGAVWQKTSRQPNKGHHRSSRCAVAGRRDGGGLIGQGFLRRIDTVNHYEDVHLCRLPEESKHVADLFQRSGICFLERVDTENGIEYVISVLSEDCERAMQIFWQDAGPGQSFTSTG